MGFQSVKTGNSIAETRRSILILLLQKMILKIKKNHKLVKLKTIVYEKKNKQIQSVNV